MGEPSRRQLGYVWSNRQQKSPTEAIGPVASRGLGPRFGAGVRHREEILECIGRAVDDTFRACCTLGKVERDRIEIIVNHPTAAAALRQQWLFHVLERLERTCRFSVTPRIRFRHGEGGDRFPEPGAGASSLVQ